MPEHVDFDDEFVDGEDDDDEWEEENVELLYLKYQFEGCSTIGELSEQLRGLAGYLDCLRLNGWRLEHPVGDGHARLVREVV